MRSIVWMMTCALALAVACGGDEAKDTAEGATSAAKEMMERAGSAAADAAEKARAAAADEAQKVADAASATAGSMAEAATGAGGDVAAAACRSLAENGAWGEALEVCKKAHEMAPDDLALEHAYQQAKAAAGK